MKFAYSTNAYTEWPLDRAVRDIAARGFDGVEILADVPHAFPPAAAVRKIALPISNVNGNTSLGLDVDGRDPSGFWPGLIDPDAATRRKKIDYVKSVIDLARRLRARNVCTATGRRPRGMTVAKATTTLRKSLDSILAHAGKKPAIRVGLEYEPGFFLGDMPSTLRILRAVDHPLLGLNLDLGHAVCVGEDPAEMIEAAGSRIWNLHLEDIKKRVHDHLVPGRGDIDFARIAKALRKIKYGGFLTLELYPYKRHPGEAGSEGLAYLKKVMA